MKKEIKMNEATIALLDKNYRDACNVYADAFCEKHGYYKLSEGRDTYWTGNKPGGVLACGDEFVDMATIITDINEDAPEEEFMKWNDYTIAYGELFGSRESKCINFHSWLAGAPRIPYDTLNHLNAMKWRLEKAIHAARKEGGLT